MGVWQDLLVGGRGCGGVAMAFKGMGMFGCVARPTPCPSASVHVSVTVSQPVIFHVL